MNTLTKWDHRFIDMAILVSSWSKDPNKKVGAVLVSPDKRQVAIGYNGLPRNSPDDLLEHLTTEDFKIAKNDISIHAEVNAILNAAVDVKGWTLYITSAPCLNCACVIVQKQIGKIVSPFINKESSWSDLQIAAHQLLEASNIEVISNGDNTGRT